MNVAYINGLIAEHSHLNLAGHTLKSLLQVRGPLKGCYAKDRAIGDAFDTVKQALGQPAAPSITTPHPPTKRPAARRGRRSNT